ncbi:hypothetical protein [Noviluteimonas gilva]|uniref:Uncharacterized protein n=1 Tax=Noviluteimonas gilva TaxID=2682097 RepID=A0A7C9M3J4_9GAMM|nr:hypothetical protein [Lysobacter gilvus]MUV14122.1 hypothetical protein [Lysobacter gilvus]
MAGFFLGGVKLEVQYAEPSWWLFARRHQTGASARRIEGHIAPQELKLRNVAFNATTAAHHEWLGARQPLVNVCAVV